MSQQREAITVRKLAERVGGRVFGNPFVEILGVASLESGRAGDIAFVEDRKFLDAARASLASCVIVPEGANLDGRCCIEAARPKLAFALIAEVLHPPERQGSYRHPTAVIAASAQIDDDVFVGAFVQVGERAQIGAGAQVRTGAVIGDNVHIGRDCVIHSHVTLYDNVHLGDRVILHAGVVVGADGFGYVPDEGNVRHKFPQRGTVLIEDDVEIGAG
ncbi:MAG TPA: LpxD N-terminal domain-containing protein, partial [Pyrinomonadaceae bacterium]|nr:LpxD N-terminal domain-containing protein [Pyrinomonadaceae bacterium]